MPGIVIGRPDLIAKRSQCIGDQYLTDSSSRFRQNTFQQCAMALRKFDDIDNPPP
jgi:hypothetical protein